MRARSSNTKKSRTREKHRQRISRFNADQGDGSGCRLQQASNFVKTQDRRYFARLAHERKVSSHICPIYRHREEETQRRNRAVDGRWTHPGLCLLQLEAAKILRRCCVGRATEEGCESLDVADIVVARLLAEIAHAHVFDHALAQWTDELLAHRGAPVLRWRFLTP